MIPVAPRLPFPHILAAACVFALPAARDVSGSTSLQGDLFAHDPSTIVRWKDEYWLFCTGRGCPSKRSKDLVSWSDGPPVFSSLPSWVAGAAPGNNGDVWAPDVIHLNDRFCLYYSVSSWGSRVSAIGLATNPTLDPADAGYRWTDRGIVVQSFESSDFNAIDPSALEDSRGNLWLSFGSYLSGIKLIQLDPSTGKRLSPASPMHSIAWNHSIEASYLYRRGAYYYLFVNWGSCCQGMTSTYHIRVGRSASITGPYLDRGGAEMLHGGGSFFLETTGRYIGPGHMGIIADEGAEWFSSHYYNADLDGAPMLDVEPLEWDSTGWPIFTREWMASYTFEEDARDTMERLDGTLVGGASVGEDPDRGHALRLSGAGQYVSLPPAAAKARTFSAWVRWNGGGAWQRVLDFGADAERYLFLTPRASTGKLRFAITDSGPGGEQVLEGPNALAAGAWTHVAVTLDGARGALYIDGRRVATNPEMTLSPASLLATDVWLGRSRFPADPYFSGSLASVRIFGRALSATEVARLVSTPDAELLAWYRLDGATGLVAVARDSTSNVNDATLNGRPVWADGALQLNGRTDFLQTPVSNGPERTLAAWIHPLSSDDVTYIESVFDSDVPGQHGSGWGLDNRMLKVILDDRFWEPRVSVALNRWTHVALTFNRTQARLYVDGAPAASLGYAQGSVSPASYRIGRSNANSLYFRGGIRDARIYGRALSGTEVRSLFEDGSRLREFVRGDANADGVSDISDAIFTLSFLFLGKGTPPCLAAADSNGDSVMDISDAVFLLNFLFSGGPRPQAPFPDCARDSSPGTLSCEAFSPCD